MQVNVLSQSKFSAPTTLPIFGFQLRPDAPELLLARIGIEELRKTHPTPVVSNVKSVYMSPWVSHLINPKLGPLCRLAESLCSEAAKMHWNVDPKVVSFKVWNCWGAIYDTADHTVSHSHFPSDLSCVAYLEAEKNCAPIVFDNHLQVNPVPGAFIIFPSILFHHVPKTSGKRTIVALNMHKEVKA